MDNTFIKIGDRIREGMLKKNALIIWGEPLTHARANQVHLRITRAMNFSFLSARNSYEAYLKQEVNA